MNVTVAHRQHVHVSLTPVIAVLATAIVAAAAAPPALAYEAELRHGRRRLDVPPLRPDAQTNECSGSVIGGH